MKNRVNRCEPTLEVQMIGYLTKTRCNKKRTHKLLLKLKDPRDAKVSIQQNPVTHSKLLLMSMMISKSFLMDLGPLQRSTNRINQLTLLLSKILCSWYIASCSHHSIDG